MDERACYFCRPDSTSSKAVKARKLGVEVILKSNSKKLF